MQGAKGFVLDLRDKSASRSTARKNGRFGEGEGG